MSKDFRFWPRLVLLARIAARELRQWYRRKIRMRRLISARLRAVDALPEKIRKSADGVWQVPIPMPEMGKGMEAIAYGDTWFLYGSAERAPVPLRKVVRKAERLDKTSWAWGPGTNRNHS